MNKGIAMLPFETKRIESIEPITDPAIIDMDLYTDPNYLLNVNDNEVGDSLVPDVVRYGPMVVMVIKATGKKHLGCLQQWCDDKEKIDRYNRIFNTSNCAGHKVYKAYATFAVFRPDEIEAVYKLDLHTIR